MWVTVGPARFAVSANLGSTPTLFATTIFENIRYGLVGTPDENASRENIENIVYTVGPARFAVSANLGSTLRVYDRPREYRRKRGHRKTLRVEPKLAETANLAGPTVTHIVCYDYLREYPVWPKIVVANNVGDCWTSEICCLSQFGLNSESL
jgi:hypothetical protein